MKKNYWHNLLLAIIGKSPFQSNTEQKPDMEQKIASYQKLVENLRCRIYEKDHLISRMKKRFRQRISQADTKIAELQKMHSPV